jgi:hypothetical protein
MGAPNLVGDVWHWRQLSASTSSTSHGNPLLPPELVLLLVVVPVEPPVPFVPPEPPVFPEPPLQAKRKRDDDSEINSAARVVTEAMAAMLRAEAVGRRYEAGFGQLGVNRSG